eukprot:2537236-Prymnesium_polylepis.2
MSLQPPSCGRANSGATAVTPNSPKKPISRPYSRHSLAGNLAFARRASPKSMKRYCPSADPRAQVQTCPKD